MLGSIIGDIVGSVYEFDNIKTKDFTLFSLESRFTDDTVCTAAVADTVLNGRDPTRTMVEWCRNYPGQGYGNLFMRWFNMPFQEPYNSFGNGAAMRVGAVAWLAKSLEEALSISDEVTAITHNHPEGIKGARAVVHATYMARTGASADSIRDKIESVYGYDLSLSVDEIRDDYEFNETCQKSVPQALICALESSSFEDAIRNGISIGGDSDTIGAIAGGLAEAMHGLDEALAANARKRLPDEILKIVDRFYDVVRPNPADGNRPEYEMKSISTSKALFIKLGVGGIWESECLREGTLRFGYQEVPHAICASGNWAEVEQLARRFSKDKGSATRHVKQIREFYGADDGVLWITFHSDRLWWSFSAKGVSNLPDGGKVRRVIGKWSDRDINGKPLLKGKLSGRLLAVQGFQGTICSVSELDYLLHKINGTSEPHVAEAQTAFERLQQALIPIISKLHPADLEILTDLVFRQAGWQRVGVSGGTEKDIDLDLISPVTGERIAVQVKSRATADVWRAYREKYADMRGFSRFYFVTHSPNQGLRKEAADAGDPDFILWDAEQLAWQAVRGGLTGWLLDKAS